MAFGGAAFESWVLWGGSDRVVMYISIGEGGDAVYRARKTSLFISA